MSEHKCRLRFGLWGNAFERVVVLPFVPVVGLDLIDHVPEGGTAGDVFKVESVDYDMGRGEFVVWVDAHTETEDCVAARRHYLPRWDLLFESHEPTAEGRRRWPDDPVGYNRNESAVLDDWNACQCAPTCPKPCKGACGCKACGNAYGDFLCAE